MKKTVVIYGLLLALLVLVLKTIEYRWLVRDISWQLYVFFIAVFFTVLGAWLAHQMFNRKPIDEVGINHQAIEQLGLSQRELEVLKHLSTGCSNQQIADRLFISVNTVKTHLKNAFVKLEADNRVAAIQKLRQLNIIS